MAPPATAEVIVKNPALLFALGLFLSSTAYAGPPIPISTERLMSSVATLSSDAFEGRAPGTPGEAKTIDWLVGQLKGLGLEPGGRDGSWTQAVPLLRTQIGQGGSMRVTTSGGAMPLAQSREIYVSTLRPVDKVAIANAPMLFVGYGVAAPERGWDDFKGVDLHGKVAVFLVNDPDFSAQAGDDSIGKFGGRRMTYYGRWTYKFEEAARRGAIAALIVHDTPGAGYGWDTVKAPGGENYDVVRRAGDERVLLQGWIEGEAAKAVFGKAGLDLDALRVKARSASFRPVELTDLGFSADLPVAHSVVQSRNVLAKLSGARRPGEIVMFGAHWDAYGQGAPDAEGRTVRAGANDDALGVAGLIEIARAFTAGPKPARSLVFGFWTAEERGLLGSEAYGADPIYKAADTVANLTLDILQTAGPARDVTLIGEGQNSLEAMLAKYAAAQGRHITPEALPERGLFYRADHFSLARRGVPTLLMMAMGGAPDLVTGGREGGEAWLKAYMRCYHQACDRIGSDWDLRGAAQDVEVMYRVGAELADSTAWPTWADSSEFKTIRTDDLKRHTGK